MCGGAELFKCTAAVTVASDRNRDRELWRGGTHLGSEGLALPTELPQPLSLDPFVVHAADAAASHSLAAQTAPAGARSMKKRAAARCWALPVVPAVTSASRSWVSTPAPLPASIGVAVAVV